MLSFVSVALLSLALPFAANADSHAARGNHHRDVAHRARGDMQMHKRFDSARWSFYDVGLGACGKYNGASDFIVALNTPQYGGGYPGPHCFQTITMTYNGKTTQATIMDQCPGCPYGGLDLSRGLFNFFASEDKGIIYGTWSFNDGSGGGGSEPETTKKADPVTTKKPDPTTTKEPEPTTTWTPPTTKQEPTTTWTPPTTKEEPTTTSTTPSSTSTWSSSSSSKASSSSVITTSSSTFSSISSSSIDYTSAALAVPTGTVASGKPENLNGFNNAIINVAGLVVAGGNII